MGQASEAGGVERTQKAARIAVTKEGFAPRLVIQFRDRLVQNATRSISAAGEPDGIDGLVIGIVNQGTDALVVRARKMAPAAENWSEGQAKIARLGLTKEPQNPGPRG